MGNNEISEKLVDKQLADKQEEVRKNLVKQYVSYRKLRNLTQEDLANLMGIKRPNISRFETGDYNPTLDLLVRMAESMNLEINVTLVSKSEEGSKDEEEQ